MLAQLAAVLTGLAADVHDAGPVGRQTERVWQMMLMMLAGWALEPKQFGSWCV